MEIAHHKKIELANAERLKARRCSWEAQPLEFADALQSTAMEFVLSQRGIPTSKYNITLIKNQQKSHKSNTFLHLNEKVTPSLAF